MTPAVAILLVLIVASAAAVALARTTLRRLISFSLFGLALSLLFFEYRAPDVALSELAVGTIGIPFIIMLTMLKLKDVQS